MEKVLAVIAVIGGVLRAGASFTSNMQATVELELFYIVIDLTLILGLIGIYLSQRASLRFLGHSGFAIAIIGFAFIAGPSATIAGIEAIAIGSPVIALGLVLYSINQISSKCVNVLAPLLLMSGIALGIIASIINLNFLSVISGVIFGFAFVLNGYWVLSSGSECIGGLGPK